MTTPRSRQAIPPHTWTKLHNRPGWIRHHTPGTATVELTEHGFRVDTAMEYTLHDPTAHQPAPTTVTKIKFGTEETTTEEIT